MTKKKDVAGRSCNKNTRKKCVKSTGSDCPDNVCPIKKKNVKKKKDNPKETDCLNVTKNCWNSFLNFVFPSRLS